MNTQTLKSQARTLLMVVSTAMASVNDAMAAKIPDTCDLIKNTACCLPVNQLLEWVRSLFAIA